MPREKQYYHQLLKRYLKNECTPREAEELLDYMQQDAANRMLLEEIRAMFVERGGQEAEAPAPWSDRVRQALLEKIQLPEAVPLYRRLLPKIAAAVLLLVLAGGAWWYMNRPQVPLAANSTPLQQVQPGGNKAVLTLADGTQITLDSAGTGTLAQQGDVNVIKLDSGQLAYQGMNGQEREMQYNTLTIPRGGQFRLTLPDGTKVWLNAVSSIRYPVAFNGNERMVELQGQAYFEIAQQPEKPFRVKVRDMEVQVLGTHFDVMAYADEHTITTTLVEGALQVKQGSVIRRLRPGQQAVRNNSTGALSVQPADIGKALAWKEGFFEFDDTGLSAILRQMARWYDIEIVDETGGEAGLFWGRVNRNLPLTSVMRMLASNGVQYRIEGKKVTISREKKRQ